MAEETVAILSGAPVRPKGNEPTRQRNLRAFYHLNEDLLGTEDDVAYSTVSLEVIEGFSPLQVLDILDLSDPVETPQLSKFRRLIPTPTHRRVMLVEDEALLAMELSEMITSANNVIVGIARTRAQAIECAKRVQPDIILTDVNLADGSSGIDAINSLAKGPNFAPAVVTTGASESVLEGREGEPVFVLRKPHSEKQLLLMMALALRNGQKGLRL